MLPMSGLRFIFNLTGPTPMKPSSLWMPSNLQDPARAWEAVDYAKIVTAAARVVRIMSRHRAETNA